MQELAHALTGIATLVGAIWAGGLMIAITVDPALAAQYITQTTPF